MKSQISNPKSHILLSRRELLKTFGAATVASLGPALPSVVCHGFADAVPGADRKPESGQNLLVVVQLAGGNDGLNTIVPYADDLYAKNRRTLRLTAKQVLKIDSLVGFHPEMPAFKRLYDEGLLSVVQGVGYPNPHGGHTESMRFWHTARPNETGVQTGWVGRAADLASRPAVELAPQPADLPAVFVGRIRRPFVINAEKTFVPAIRDLEHATLREAGGGGRGTGGGKGTGSESPRCLSPFPMGGGGQRTATIRSWA